jgi:hypothetical protein
LDLESAESSSQLSSSAIYPVAGALLGTCLGGPVGLLAGVKIGGLAAIGGSVFGNLNYFTIFQGREVEFHEIEIQFFHEIEFLIMRSNFNLFMRSKLSNKINQEADTSIMRSKFKKRIIRNFDLMIDLLVPSTIMRSKFKINYINFISCTCG